MSFLAIFLLGLGLSMDCFAVSVGLGATRTLTWKDVLKMAAFFGFFQGMMPLLGWMIGDLFQSLIREIDHWIAFGILAFIGMKMIGQSFRVGHSKKKLDINHLSVLLTLSIATSIDAFISGITFGFINVNVWLTVLLIGVITFIMTIIGSRIGHRSSFIPARWAEVLGGVILIAVGLNVLMTHIGIW